MRGRQQGTKTSKGYWRVCVNVTDEYGRKIVKTFERKSLTQAQEAARIYLAKHGRIIQSDPPGVLSELFKETESAVWSHTGRANRAAMALYVKKWNEILGDAPVDSLDSPSLTRAMHVICAGQSTSYINKAKRCIKQALDYAVSDLGWITTNPAEIIRMPKGCAPKTVYPPITRAEYERMLGLASPRVRLLLRLVAECGMRPIEAERVRPEHLFTVHDKWLVTIPKSKSKAGVRSVPVPDSLMREIQARKDEDWEGVKNPLDHIRHWWRAHSKCRMYDLRGWCSDEWRRRGVPDQVRSWLMGHVDPKFTQKVYEQITSEDTLSMFG